MTTETPKTTDAQPAPKKGRKLLIIGTLVLVFAGAGGGAGWYFMKPADANVPHEPPKPKPSVFLAMEPFTVNLLPQDGQGELMQTAITLKLVDQHSADVIKERMPEVRNRVLMVLSGKRGSELLPVAGKQKLATEIAEAVKGVVAPQHAAKPAPAAADKPAPAAAEAHGAAPATQQPAATQTPAAPQQPAAHAQPQIEVLFTSFIIQ